MVTVIRPNVREDRETSSVLRFSTHSDSSSGFDWEVEQTATKCMETSAFELCEGVSTDEHHYIVF